MSLVRCGALHPVMSMSNLRFQMVVLRLNLHDLTSPAFMYLLWMTVSPPPFISWNFPMSWYFEVGTLGSPHDWDYCPCKRNPERSLVPSATWGHTVKSWPSMDEEAGPHQISSLLALWPWDLPAYRTVINIVYKPPSRQYCYSSPNGLSYVLKTKLQPRKQTLF